MARISAYETQLKLGVFSAKRNSHGICSLHSKPLVGEGLKVVGGIANCPVECWNLKELAPGDSASGGSCELSV